MIWGWVVYLHFLPPQKLQFDTVGFLVSFVYDSLSLPWLLGIATLLVMVLITVPLYPDFDEKREKWSEYLILSLIGMLAAASENAWMIVFCWMAFDIFEQLLFPVFWGYRSDVQGSRSVAVSRISGIVLATVSFVVLPAAAGEDGSALLAPMSAGLLSVAGFLRLGFFPLQVELPDNKSQISVFQMALRVFSLVTVLPILGRTDFSVFPNDVYPILAGITLAALITGGLGWQLTAKGVSRGFLINLIAGFAFISAIRGSAVGLASWGITLLFAAMPFFLYTRRTQLIRALLFFLLMLMTGLPGTPNAFGWNGILKFPLTFSGLILLICQMLMLNGCFTQVLDKTGDDTAQKENWVGSVYPFGLTLCLLAYILTSQVNLKFSQAEGVVWASITSIMLVLLLRSGVLRNLTERNADYFAGWKYELIRFFWKVVSGLRSFSWFETPVQRLLQWLGALVRFISSVFEGNAGILWELLLLISLLMVIVTGQA